jgi:hypothetical protein
MSRLLILLVTKAVFTRARRPALTSLPWSLLPSLVFMYMQRQQHDWTVCFYRWAPWTILAALLHVAALADLLCSLLYDTCLRRTAGLTVGLGA